jgi:hypothetical protein
MSLDELKVAFRKIRTKEMEKCEKPIYGKSIISPLKIDMVM